MSCAAGDETEKDMSPILLLCGLNFCRSLSLRSCCVWNSRLQTGERVASQVGIGVLWATSDREGFRAKWSVIQTMGNLWNTEQQSSPKVHPGKAFVRKFRGLSKAQS